MFLADLPSPSPVEFSSWMISFAAAAALFLVILKIIDHFKGKKGVPQPLQVQYAQRLATHDELMQLRDEFENFRDRAEGQYNEIIASGEKRRDDINREIRMSVGKVHDRVDLLNSRVGEIVGELKRIGV